MKNSYEPLGTAVAIKVTSSPEQIVAVAAAVNTTPLMFAVRLAAGAAIYTHLDNVTRLLAHRARG